jgi:hypothetical protein
MARQAGQVAGREGGRAGRTPRARADAEGVHWVAKDDGLVRMLTPAEDAAGLTGAPSEP